MHRCAETKKRSTANEGQSTGAGTARYRGSALAPDLKNPTTQIIGSSMGGLPHAVPSDVASVNFCSFSGLATKCHGNKGLVTSLCQDGVNTLPQLAAIRRADAKGNYEKYSRGFKAYFLLHLVLKPHQI